MKISLRESNVAFRNDVDSEELMHELYRQMLQVARHKLIRKMDAVDIVQEAWVRILEKRDSLRDEDKLIPWAKTIVYNLASNANRARRSRSSRQAFYDDDIPEYVAQAGAGVDPELLTELSDMLGRLDPTARTLLLYKFYYGFRDDEIAAALEMPVGTIKSRIHRERERIHKEQIKNERSPAPIHNHSSIGE
ncbi:RNA polymerase sigma factor [Cohnella fermenti]|uniref:RNA polymerase sigma factor n=1 Tax=Cohnella fermenti TaxID=2565925 RepID=A0A4S4BGU5_9BACL|nr:RNA polymerase sigma factor [Cohnella fermenti]THF73079.1 RNA polymerase sigma factor [Cohnella fermenti]